jgi:hypothetical protein
MESALLDVCGRHRSPATLPGYHSGRPPMNKGLRYPADPPSGEEIVAVMRGAGDRTDGVRLRGLIVCPVAGWAADQRGPQLDRKRSRPDAGRNPGAPRQGR